MRQEQRMEDMTVEDRQEVFEASMNSRLQKLEDNHQSIRLTNEIIVWVAAAAIILSTAAFISSLVGGS